MPGDDALPAVLIAYWRFDAANFGKVFASWARMLQHHGQPGGDSRWLWTLDFPSHRIGARERMQPLLDQAAGTNAAAPDATFTLARDHYVTEQYIKACGMAWIFLRDSFYIDFMKALVGDDGVIHGPAGDGRCAVVAHVDVARTAAAVLTDPAAHAGHSYDLTGPQALSLAGVAATIARARGRAESFVDQTVDEAYASRASFGAPDWQADAWVSTHTAITSGVMAPVRRCRGRERRSADDFGRVSRSQRPVTTMLADGDRLRPR